MSNQISGWDDTIVALATPHGNGGKGVSLLSGYNSFSIFKEIVPYKKLA